MCSIDPRLNMFYFCLVSFLNSKCSKEVFVCKNFSVMLKTFDRNIGKEECKIHLETGYVILVCDH